MLKPIVGPLAAAALMALFALPSPAQAGNEYPWCAQYSERTVGATNCGFVTLAQCRATVSGIGGACYENPAYFPAEPRRQRPRAQRH